MYRKPDELTEKTTPEKLKKATIHVTGMTCSTCAVTVEKRLAETPGVENSVVNLASEKATLEYDPSKTDLAKINSVVSGLGYGLATGKSVFPVRGMMCATCVGHVEEALRSVTGVISANVNLASEKAVVEYVEGTAIGDIKNAVKDAGYELGSETETLEDVTTA
jgi:Cu+-exporting ATPase